MHPLKHPQGIYSSNFFPPSHHVAEIITRFNTQKHSQVSFLRRTHLATPPISASHTHTSLFLDILNLTLFSFLSTRTIKWVQVVPMAVVLRAWLTRLQRPNPAPPHTHSWMTLPTQMPAAVWEGDGKSRQTIKKNLALSLQPLILQCQG